MARLYQPGCYEEDVQAGEGAGERSTLAAPREPALATPSNAHPSPRASVEMSTDRASPKRLKAMALLGSPGKPPTLDPRGRVVLCAVMEAFLRRENQQELLPGSIGQHLRDTHHKRGSGVAETERFITPEVVDLLNLCGMAYVANCADEGPMTAPQPMVELALRTMNDTIRRIINTRSSATALTKSDLIWIAPKPFQEQVPLLE